MSERQMIPWSKVGSLIDTAFLTSDRHEFDPDEMRKDINGVRPIEVWNRAAPAIAAHDKTLYCLGDLGNCVTRSWLMWRSQTEPLCVAVPGNHDPLVCSRQFGYIDEWCLRLPNTVRGFCGVYGEHGDIIDRFWSRDERWTKSKKVRLALGQAIIHVADKFERLDHKSDERAIAVLKAIHDKVIPRGLRINGNQYERRAEVVWEANPWMKVYAHGHDHRAAYVIHRHFRRVGLNSWMHSGEDNEHGWHRRGECAPYLFGCDTWNLYKATIDGLILIVEGNRDD